MTVFLPDTNVLIETLKRNPKRSEMLRQLLLQGHSLASCAVTMAEVYAGMRPSEALGTAELLSTLIWVDTTAAVARRAGGLIYEWGRKGVTLTLADTMIAATALHYGLTLITENVKDFPMPELQLYPLDGKVA
jgi:predicted nucleic acid-binding protein